MMELKEVLMDIRKELRASDKYAKEAVKHKKEFPGLFPKTRPNFIILPYCWSAG